MLLSDVWSLPLDLVLLHRIVHGTTFSAPLHCPLHSYMHGGSTLQVHGHTEALQTPDTDGSDIEDEVGLPALIVSGAWPQLCRH